MGWEQRKRTGRYYYRLVRRGGKTVRQYVGRGVLGEIAADLDERIRRERKQARAGWTKERAALETADAALNEYYEAVGQAVGYFLLAGGLHQHRGEWRQWRSRRK